MTTKQTAPQQTGHGRGSPSTFSHLAVAAVLILAGLLVYREHPLVQLATDPPDSSAALFPTGDLQRGQSTTATVSLANRGLIPFTYGLQVTGPGGQPVFTGMQLQVRPEGDRAPVYRGALSRPLGPMGQLDPGQAVRLELTVSNPSDNQDGRTSLNLLFRWTAQGSLLGVWWQPVYALSLAVLDLAILLACLLEVRRRRRAAGSDTFRAPATEAA